MCYEGEKEKHQQKKKKDCLAGMWPGWAGFCAGLATEGSGLSAGLGRPSSRARARARRHTARLCRLHGRASRAVRQNEDGDGGRTATLRRGKEEEGGTASTGRSSGSPWSRTNQRRGAGWTAGDEIERRSSATARTAAGETAMARRNGGAPGRFRRRGRSRGRGGAFAPHGDARGGLPRQDSAVNRGGDEDVHGDSRERKTEGIRGRSRWGSGENALLLFAGEGQGNGLPTASSSTSSWFGPSTAPGRYREGDAGFANRSQVVLSSTRTGP